MQAYIEGRWVPNSVVVYTHTYMLNTLQAIVEFVLPKHMHANYMLHVGVKMSLPYPSRIGATGRQTI